MASLPCGRDTSMHLTSHRLDPLFGITFNLLIIVLPLVLLAVPPVAQAEPFVALATYAGVINPVSAEYLHDALVWAEENGAQALVVALNTPGGLEQTMRLNTKDLTGASTPDEPYVCRSRGRAATGG